MKSLNNKGVTIVEAVISMALVIIIASTSITLAISAKTASYNSYLSFEAQNKCADFIEVFKVSKTNEEFFGYIDSIYPDCVDRTYGNGAVDYVINNVHYNVFCIQDTIMLKATSNNNIELFNDSYNRG